MSTTIEIPELISGPRSLEQKFPSLSNLQLQKYVKFQFQKRALRLRHVSLEVTELCRNITQLTPKSTNLIISERKGTRDVPT